MGFFFYRETTFVEAVEGFEYVGGWPSTIADINYPDTFLFDSPIAIGVEDFESGW